MLDGVELQTVQEVEGAEAEAVRTHAIPALEGDFLQDLGRRATRISLNGILIGPDVADSLKKLREKFRRAVAVPFVADIASATRVEKVLIEDFGVRELAGKPERFEYALTLREFIPIPQPKTEPPPPPPPPVKVTASLTVEVVVTGQPAFDFSTVVVSVDGTQDDSTSLSRTLTHRQNNVWTEDPIPSGDYTAHAVVSSPQAMTGSAAAKISPGEKKHVTITLTPSAPVAKAFIVHFWFDRAFIEPCLKAVLRQAADRARNTPNEKVVIVGHTDLTGTADYNQSLSERRARSVYAMLTFGRDRAGAVAEWNSLRQPASGGLPSVKDSWGVREYQFMLQDLDFYDGNVDEQHGVRTDAAVRAFQTDRGLPSTGVVDDATWSALIEAYMGTESLAIPESQFLRNANESGCDGGILKWLGCGEQDPVKNTQDAFRPNRRTELLFVVADKPPCPVAKPVTFDLPSPGLVGTSWCLGGGDENKRCCFIARHGEPDVWPLVSAEPGSVTVRGSIKLGDGTPLANAKFVLTAPDGEYMNGEHPSPPDSGRPIPGRTGDDGSFSFPDRPKGIGIYILTVLGPFVLRLSSDPPGSGKGNSVCMRLDGSADFNAIAEAADTGDPKKKLRGTLFDEFGKALARTAASIAFEDGSSVPATTDADGKFVVDMNAAFSSAKISFPGASGTNVTQNFFIDVGDVATDDGLRRRLANLGYLTGDDVAAATLAFQAAQGLDTSGDADASSRSKLVSVHDGSDPILPPFPVDESPLPARSLLGVGPPE